MSHLEGFAGIEARRQNAVSLLLLLLVCLAFLLRFAVSSEIVNRFVSYTDEGGAIFEKFHWGSYAIFLMLPVALAVRPILLDPDDVPRFRSLFRFTAVMAALAVLMFGLGRSGASGFLIDTYMVAGTAGMLMFCVNAASRRAIGHVMLWLMLASAAVGIVEALTSTRINPYDVIEEVFRPTGLTNHPLSLGLLCATAIGFAAVSDWKMPARIAAILLLFVGTALSGARFATLLAAVAVLAVLMLTPWPGLSPRAVRKAKLAVLVLALLGGALLVAMLLAGGMLARFSDGIVDENFFARVTIYEVFGHTGLSAILFGTDIDAVLAIVNERLGLPYIESSPVVFIYQLGLPLALVFVWLIVALFRRLLRGAALPVRIATLVFFLAALSNNTLSTKTPTVALMVVLIIAFATPAARPGVRA